MGRYEFQLATPADEAGLRHILRSTPMPGKISVTFRRDPNYFDAAVVDGPFRQTVVCRDNDTGQLVGLGARSVRPRFVNGQAQPIGYLSLLRLLAGHRNRGLVARGYRYFRDLHQDQRCPLYLTTIAQGNQSATSVLTQDRAGLPRYFPVGEFHTAVIPLGKTTAPSAEKDLEIRAATNADLDTILEFLARCGPRRQFFPQYGQHDFFSPDGTFRDLEPADLLLAFRQQRLIGTVGGWDQHRFRQTFVERIGGPLRWVRPIYNGWAALWGHPLLPQRGQCWRHVVAAIPLVENDDHHVFDALIASLSARLAHQNHGYLLVGLHETDPLRPVAVKRAFTTYVTNVYYVCWPEGESLYRRLDNRQPYLELGCL